jgi:DNA-binding SARP family transcriptional activator
MQDLPAGDGTLSPGQVLRKQRSLAGLSQLQLARKAGISVGVVRDLEQGVTTRLQARSAERLAAVLGLAPGDLAGSTTATSPASSCAARQGDGTGLQIRVLGPLQAWIAGRAIPLGPPRQQAVLGLLAANLGSIVRRETITNALWVTDAPPTSTAMIQTYVSRLRAILGVGRDGVRCHFQSGYQLVAGAAQVDLVSFSRLARHARTALDLGQPADACELYEQALALWRGEALAGLDVLRTHPSVTRLHRQWASTVMGYADAAARLGAHDRVLPHLRLLADRDPLNERGCAGLMITLAACGQQAAAFAAYEQIRRRLDDEFGVRPGPELAGAHLRILRNLVPMSSRVPVSGRAALSHHRPHPGPLETRATVVPGIPGQP